ncbi:ribonucleotide reductase subunit alpha [Alkalimonas sp.]|uniref:ribonucleotide reductase subunit alpha n=1 Tax=Alkalimonas sp. TaxID=1872453 RepID=UPI00263BCC79|nr:ribonucleotide reductase subunit alpha [Alkalimonas sp.]MCC5826560.1 ribonucleotide reductase subunit alpha [Alkalimonas sp.]
MFSTYSQFIEMAYHQAEPQRLLFVLTKMQLPKDATPEQQARFEQGEGGYLESVLCVDKLPEDVRDFAAFVEESKQTELDWDIAFISSMEGRAGFAPNSDEAVQPLKLMVQRIEAGQVANFLAVNKQGELLQFQ